ncbi:MAG: translocation/assembly module TamB domain-containing protein [Bacteroidales bacterium]
MITKRTSKHKALRLVFKIISGIIAGIVLILLLLQLIVLIPAVQNGIKNKAISVLQENLNSKVTIDKFRLGFPKKLEVHQMLIASSENDTLFFTGKISIDIDLLPLLKKKISIRKLEVSHVKGDIAKLIGQLSSADGAIDSTHHEPARENTDSWEFSIHKLDLSAVELVYQDENEGFELVMDVGSLKLRLGDVNLDTLIHCKSIDLSHSDVSLTFLEAALADEEVDTSAFSFANIRIGEVNLESVGFTLIDSVDAMMLYTGIGKLFSSNSFVDITNEVISIDGAGIKDAFCDIDFLSNADTLSVADSSADKGLNWGQYLWKINGNKLHLDNCRYSMDYLDEEELKGHFDPNHMNINNASGIISDFNVDDGILNATIQDLKAREDNGLEILGMEATLGHKQDIFFIEGCRVKTYASELFIEMETEINPTDYSLVFSKNSDILLKYKSSDLRDIDFFYPISQDSVIFSPVIMQKGISLDFSISGSLANMNLDSLYLHLLDNTTLKVAGSINNLHQPENAQFDVVVEQLHTTDNDASYLFADLQNNTAFHFPEFIDLYAVVEGGLKKQHINAQIQSSAGQIKIQNASINLTNRPEFVFDIKAGLHDLKDVFDAGIDRADFSIAGSLGGENIYEAQGVLSTVVDSLHYNGYTYSDIALNGGIDHGHVEAQVQSADSSLSFTLRANGDLNANHTNFFLIDFDFHEVDLFALKLIGEPLKFEGKTELTFHLMDVKDFEVEANIDNLYFHFADTLYSMHPAHLIFNSNDTLTQFDLDSYFYNLHFVAEEDIIDFGQQIRDLPYYYLADPSHDSVVFEMAEFSINGQLDYPEAFARLFFPGLPSFKELTIDGAYNKSQDQIAFTLNMPGLQYDNLFVDSLYFALDGTSEKLYYEGLSNVSMEGLISGKISFSGNFHNSELITQLNYKDSYSDSYLDITAQIDTARDNLIIHILPDSLIFSYDEWEINSKNKITINPAFIAVNDFDLTSNGQTIKISTFPEDSPKNLQLELGSFKLGSLEHLFNSDTVIGGTANCAFRFYDILANPAIEGSLTIDQLNLFNVEAGHMDLSSFAFRDNELNVDLALKGRYQDITLKGNWQLDNGVDPLNFDLVINHLDLSELNYLLDDYISNAKGQLKSEIKISGSTIDPKVNGFVNFKDAGIGINSLKNYFTLGAESISIRDNVIAFDGFSIANKNDHSAKVNGSIALDKSSKIYSDLMLVTDNMEIMNSTNKDSDLLYGLLKAEANIHILGPADALKVNADVSVDPSTDLTYIFPDNLALDDNRGIVRFGKFSSDMIQKEELKDAGSLFSIQSFNDLKSKIEIVKGARFKIYFDNLGHNFLDASLSGNINYNLYQQISEVSGMFEIENGKLHYALPMVSGEEYEIEPGSYLTLSNDLYNPYLNIAASSKIRASTEGLMADYAKVMTFKVMLYMSGELNDIKLRFDIASETNDALVSARISQLTPEERNMNALNLLVRGAFVISIQGNEAGSASMMDAQLDKFYTSQLNQLISDNIQFVDLKFDVQSFKDYNSSGQIVKQRNYYYNIGKSFLHNRARINYKGSLGVTSDLQAEQVNSQFVQNELELEVKITKNGNYRGVFFRKNQYEGLLEGEVIQTGGGIRIRRDYFSIRDIFTNEERKERKKLQNSNGNEN